jgi:hypothetical protein
MSAVRPVVCGNAESAISCACTDSYLAGRKAVWSVSVMSERLGAKPTRATAATTQTAITRQGWATTDRPSRANTGSTPP